MKTASDLMTSKKFIASIIASLLALIGLLNGFTATEIALIITPLAVYTGSQGMADFGKEAPK